MTRVVQRLVRQGLARVEQRVDDGRKTDVFLTVAGRRACADVRRIASRVYARAFADFSDEDVGRLCELLRRAHANLSAGDLAGVVPMPPQHRRSVKKGRRSRQ
jgi:DNA-binding MarR family transcriptional regulator